MITVEITRKNGHIIKVKSTGHANYAEQGKDIICSAVSTCLSQAALYLLNHSLGEITEQEIGLFEFKLFQKAETEKDKVTAVLASMMLMLHQIRINYPKHLKISDEGCYNLYTE